MPTLGINVDTNAFDKKPDGYVAVRVSSRKNNGLSMNENGQIVAAKGRDGNPGSGGTVNFPGNSISGTPNQGIGKLRCNKNVSRRFLGAPEDEGYHMVNVSNFKDESTIVGKILKYIESGGD